LRAFQQNKMPIKTTQEIEAAAAQLRETLAQNEAAVKAADEAHDYPTFRAQSSIARIHRQRLWALDWVLGNIEEEA
jgi:tRNA C32,U32 (ribose-2'-O)-methylase TrmJ